MLVSKSGHFIINISPAMTFITKRKKAVQTPLVLAGTISTMTVKRIANQVSANR